jgi:hypothetical protein
MAVPVVRQRGARGSLHSWLGCRMDFSRSLHDLLVPKTVRESYVGEHRACLGRADRYALDNFAIPNVLNVEQQRQ